MENIRVNWQEFGGYFLKELHFNMKWWKFLALTSGCNCGYVSYTQGAGVQCNGPRLEHVADSWLGYLKLDYCSFTPWNSCSVSTVASSLLHQNETQKVRLCLYSFSHSTTQLYYTCAHSHMRTHILSIFLLLVFLSLLLFLSFPLIIHNETFPAVSSWSYFLSPYANDRASILF